MESYNLTEHARQVLAVAREEAARLGSEWVAAGHQLLALLAPGRRPAGRAEAALHSLGTDPDALYAAAAARTQRQHPPDDSTAGPDRPYTATAKRAIELAVREAAALPSAQVGTEHLLLALLRLGSGQVPEVEPLESAGVTHERARATMRRAAGLPDARSNAEASDADDGTPAPWKTRDGRTIRRAELVIEYDDGAPRRIAVGSREALIDAARDL